jgi:hypothetical protein
MELVLRAFFKSCKDEIYSMELEDRELDKEMKNAILMSVIQLTERQEKSPNVPKFGCQIPNCETY